MFYSDDPVADFERYDAEKEAALANLPVCSECGQPICDEECFYINGEAICESCMNDNYRIPTTHLMG